MGKTKIIGEREARTPLTRVKVVQRGRTMHPMSETIERLYDKRLMIRRKSCAEHSRNVLHSAQALAVTRITNTDADQEPLRARPFPTRKRGLANAAVAAKAHLTKA